MRALTLAVLLALAAGLVIAGCALLSTALALVVSGLSLAGLAWLFVGEVAE